MTAFAVLTRKELLEAWRTRRLPAVLVMFVAIGILSPLTARYLPEILKAALGDQLTVPIPRPTAADAVLQLQKNLGQLGAFAAIVLAMGAVASEKERGTASFLLTKPIGRGAFLGAKLVAQGVVLGLAVLASTVVAWTYSAVLFQPGPIVGWLALTVLAWLGLAVWAAITFLASTVSGSSAAAAGIGVVALIGLSLVSAIPSVGRFLPPGLDGPALALATGDTAGLAGDELATAVLGCVALIALVGLVSWLAFRRQEL
jgi:ABC-2 type transport system permease protein